MREKALYLIARSIVMICEIFLVVLITIGVLALLPVILVVWSYDHIKNTDKIKEDDII